MSHEDQLHNDDERLQPSYHHNQYPMQNWQYQPSDGQYSQNPYMAPIGYAPQYVNRLKLRRFQAAWYPKVNLKIARRAFSRIGLALLVYTLSTSVFYSLISAGIDFWFPQPQGQWVNIIDTLESSGAQYFVGFPLCLLIMQLVPSFPPRPRADDPAARMTPKRWISIFIMGIPLMYAGSILGNLTADSLSNGNYSNILESMYADPTPASMLIDAVITVLMAPIVEEIVFRKMIIDRLHRYGEALAIGVSAMLFALMHANPYQFFYTLAWGAMWAYIYLRTGKIQYTIWLHMAVNFMGGVVPTVLSLIAGDEGSLVIDDQQSAKDQFSELMHSGGVVYVIYGLFILGLVIAGIVMWVRNRKKIELRPADWQLVPGIAARTAWLNVGMMLFVVLTVFATIVSPFLSIFH